MSANEIVFDAQYTSEQVKTLDKATELVHEAVDFLKKASLHDGWKCRECNTINDKINTITTRLGKLDQGMTATAEALARGRDRFTELEECATTQADGMANDLKNKYGFEASTYGQDGNTNLPVTQIPETQTDKAKIDGFPFGGIKGLFGKILDIFSPHVYAAEIDFANATFHGTPIGDVDIGTLTEEERKEYNELLEIIKSQGEIESKDNDIDVAKIGIGGGLIAGGVIVIKAGLGVTGASAGTLAPAGVVAAIGGGLMVLAGTLLGLFGING